MNELIEAAKQGNAYKRLNQMFENDRARIINKLFNQHYLPSTDVSLERVSRDSFVLNITHAGNVNKIKINLNDETTLDNKNGIQCSLSHDKSDIKERIDSIKAINDSKKRRGKLSELYNELCLFNSIDSECKYPRGS